MLCITVHFDISTMLTIQNTSIICHYMKKKKKRNNNES